METENADKLVEEFGQMVMDLDGNGIFTHNAFLALLMFIWLWCSLGNNVCIRDRLCLCIIVAFKSRSNSLGIFFTTFGMLELIAYSIAISRSALLVKTLVKKSKFKTRCRIYCSGSMHNDHNPVCCRTHRIWHN